MSSSITALVERQTALAALWQTTIRLDKSKINTWIAFRNSLAVAIPLAVGMATGNPLGGVAVTTGALNVSYSDGHDPYLQRARRMLTWSLLGGVAVFTGSVSGSRNWLAVCVTVAWAFIAGMQLAMGTRAGDLGLNTLVTVIVFSARGAMSPLGALYAGLLAFGGGLLQMAFALSFWPLRRYDPQRRTVGTAFENLATGISTEGGTLGTASLDMLTADDQEVVAALGQDHTLEGARYRLLFDQADRIRLSLFLLLRVTDDLDGVAQHITPDEKKVADAARQLTAATADLLTHIGQCLVSNSNPAPKYLQRVRDITEMVYGSAADTPLTKHVVAAMQTLAGQLRVVAEMANRTLPEGSAEFDRMESAKPWRLRIAGWLATLNANLHLKSPICRHAIRLAVCVGIGDIIGRSIEWQRSYWIPMTLAVVLKPDFASTFSRGALRLSGTFAGLVIATVLYHVLPHSALTQLFLVGIFTYMLRSIGPANYGVFTAAVSGLIVFLIAATGIRPGEVVVERALNTAAGGVLALIAYALWPTWERYQVSEAMATMFDQCRLYFRAVAQKVNHPEAPEKELDRARHDWLQSRFSADGSVDRFATEPRTNPKAVDLLLSMLASAHSLVYATMGIDAGTGQQSEKELLGAFQNFAHDVEFTLYFLAAAMRGSHAASKALPVLREDHTKLVKSREVFPTADDFLVRETDRITVSLNTLREKVEAYLAIPVSEKPEKPQEVSETAKLS